MLFAVEGGGFFSSSASGYSKGLTLLLLDQKNEDKPMRVTPWNQYQLDQEPDPDLQLASFKNQLSRGCASFVCFGRASAGIDSPSPLKVGPTRQLDVLPDHLVDDKGGDSTIERKDNCVRKVSLKSSLKKQLNRNSVPTDGDNQYNVASGGNGCEVPAHMDRRKVQWTDVHGSELVQVREFEPSETCGSDNEADGRGEKICSCAIM